jgi:hypothetical protein
MALETSMFPWQQEKTAVMEMVFSTWSMSRCYKQGQLAVEVCWLLS